MPILDIWLGSEYTSAIRIIQNFNIQKNILYLRAE